ncbi:Alpha/Beta hydrolase protein [Lactarius deliciosus]|nr:Alpha/Beta hydrolase protein [Lactarius deliciosus]
MTSEQPFQIAVSDDALALLKRKLDDTRLPDEVNAAEWAYGTPLADIKRLVSRWKDGYDWRTHERKLNALPMFTRPIAVDGFGELSVHYVHQKSAAKGAIPLLFVNGSFPGYAWSEGVLEKGFHGKHYAELFNKLMISLGYTEYVTQGGNWGNVLTLTTASLYGPKHVKASHTNLPMSDPPKLFKNPIVLLKCLIMSFTSREREAAARTRDFFENRAGYFAVQSTKPQTLGYSLADSPVGLLAWVYEKLVTWTDAYPWTDDEVLTWISIFLFSRAGPAASIRLYYELARTGELTKFPKTTVPVGLSFFPKDLVRFPKVLLRSKGRIVFESEHEVGGHFAAYEQPEALVGDLRKMFGKSGPAAGIVPSPSTLLDRKLDDTRLPDEVIAPEWAYSAPLANIKRLVSRWKDGYDRRPYARELNALSMFIRTFAVERFGELSVHYYVGAISLLFVHGCTSSLAFQIIQVVKLYTLARPGSFLEMTKVLLLLTAVSMESRGE